MKLIKKYKFGDLVASPDLGVYELPEVKVMAQGKTNPHSDNYYLAQLGGIIASNSILPIINNPLNLLIPRLLRMLRGDWDRNDTGREFGDYTDYSQIVDEAEGYTNKCAQYVNDRLKREGYCKTSKGNAWSKPAGTRIIFDGRPDDREKDIDRRSLIKYYTKAADNFAEQWNPDLLDPNNKYTVNMYYATSPYASKAYTEGNGAGSHIGMLVNIDGDWYVEDEVKGKVNRTRVEHLLGSKNNAGILTLYQDE